MSVRKIWKSIVWCLESVLCICVCCKLYTIKCNTSDKISGFYADNKMENNDLISEFREYFNDQKVIVDYMEESLQRLRLECKLEELLEEKSNEDQGDKSYLIYEKYFKLRQGKLARCMNISNAEELGREGLLNSHFTGITIRIDDDMCIQYNNIGRISEYLLPCGIIIDNDDSEYGFMGARAGMDFIEIQSKAYQTEVKVGFMYNKEIDVYYVEYEDDFYIYRYLSYNPEGKNSWLLIEKRG